MMVDSDEWQTTITYDGATAPDDFETDVFSTLPTFSNTPIGLALQFQRKPDWYISPSGTGVGKTPNDPGSAGQIIGDGTSANFRARGYRYVTLSLSGDLDATLTRNGDFPSGVKTRYSTDDSEPTAEYTAPVAITKPTILKFFVESSDGVKLTRTFRRTLCMKDAKITAQWYASSKTLELYATDTSDAALVCPVTILYQGQPYTGPITIAAPVIPVVQLTHATINEPLAFDFDTETEQETLPAIDPDTTPDFTQTYTVTFTRADSSAIVTHAAGPDLVWACEGTYTNPTGATSTYFQSDKGITVRGGYSADFTERDVKNRKTIFRAMSWGSAPSQAVNGFALALPNTVDGGIIDGCWGEAATVASPNTTSSIFKAAIAYNCHFEWEESIAGGAAPNGRSIVFKIFGDCPLSYYCSVLLDLSVGPGGDASADDTNGGSSWIDVTVAQTAYGSDYDLTLTTGNGGNGGKNEGESEYAPPTTANGGASYVKASCGSLSSGTLTASLTSGNGGRGGDAKGGGTYRLDSGGDGGGARAEITVNLDSGSIADCTLTAGNGGNGGTGASSGLPGKAGDTGAIVWGSVGYASKLTTVNTCGNSGAGGTGGGNTGSCGGLTANVHCSGLGPYAEIDATCTTGNQGAGTNFGEGDYFQNQALIRIASGPAAYRVKIKGTLSAGTVVSNTWSAVSRKAFLVFGNGYDAPSLSFPMTCRFPIYFEEGDISVTEDGGDARSDNFYWPHYAAGNPVRVNALSIPYYSSTVDSCGWYSGTPNGDGAPLKGYETPQGTGVALGRYWE
jgi:hypothetical protein